MKKNAFTLIELIVVIIIIVATTVLIVVKVEKNVKDATALKEKQLIDEIENSAYIYSTTYTEELINLNSINVEQVELSTIISKGLLNTKSLSSIPTTDVVIIAKINNNIKVKYNIDQSYTSAIFLLGLEEIKIKKGSNYEDDGAYVAVPNIGVSIIEPENIETTVNATTNGKYKVTYTYATAKSVERIVNVDD